MRSQVMQPQQVMLEVRFVEISRTAGRELGVQWNGSAAASLANIGNRAAGRQLPITAAVRIASASRRWRALRRGAVRLHDRPPGRKRRARPTC